MNDKDKLKWFFQKYIFPRKKSLFVLILLIFVGSSVANLSPYLYGKMLDSITSSDISHLTILIIGYFVLTIFSSLLSALEGYIGGVIDFKLSKRVQRDLFNNIIRMRTGSYTQYKTGELISRLNGDTGTIVDFSINLLTSSLQIAINFLISIYFIIHISLTLSSVALFYLPASFLTTMCIRKHYKTLAERERKFSDEYYSFQTQVFNNNIGIKSFNIEGLITEKYSNYIATELSMLKKSIKLGGINQVLGSVITVISALFIIYVSALLINDGLLTIGLMVAFNTYINKFFASVSQILGLNISIQRVTVSLNRIYNLLHDDVEHETSDRNGFKENNLVGKTITIKNIHFKYPDTQESVLSQMDLEIKETGLYSIIGTNGCGKSTLAKLLIRLYDPDFGQILIDSVDISTINYKTLRQSVTYIPKEEFFFNETVMESLKMGDTNISDDAVIQMCNQLGIAKFIDVLPEKYNTLVGEGGGMFSSGQKQKLSISRALLRNTPIYIFDELTANLDGASDKEIMDMIREISKKAIVIFISHKLTSIKDSKVIFLMENGRIINAGTHHHLLNDEDLYKTLFQDNIEKDIAI